MPRLFLAVLCSAVLGIFTSPAFGFIGVNYSPFHYPGQSPNLATPIPDSQIIADLQTIAQRFEIIRTYGVDATTRLDRIVPLANANTPRLKVWLGIYENGTFNGAANKTYLDTAISQANTYPNIDAVVVGNECLPGDPIGNPVSVAQMIADLQYVKARITNKNIKVTTCLTYGAAADNRGQQLAPYCDVIMVNIYPFYGGVSISNNQAINNLINAYKNIFIPKSPAKPSLSGKPAGPVRPPTNPSIKRCPVWLTRQPILNRYSRPGLNWEILSSTPLLTSRGVLAATPGGLIGGSGIRTALPSSALVLGAFWRDISGVIDPLLLD